MITTPIPQLHKEVAALAITVSYRQLNTDRQESSDVLCVAWKPVNKKNSDPYRIWRCWIWPDPDPPNPLDIRLDPETVHAYL